MLHLRMKTMQQPIRIMQTILQPTDPCVLSAQFLQALRAGITHVDILARLSAFSLSELGAQLDNPPRKLAFWLNLYNACNLQALREQPEMYNRKSLFFSRRFIPLAGTLLSLDDIEHGILRRSAWKYGLGYLRRPFPARWEKILRMDAVDCRIHFALNCGAVSCPPLAEYLPKSVDAQLDRATGEYLRANCRFEEGRNRIALPRLLLWFRGDFGGRAGMLELLRCHGILQAGVHPRFHYLDYDWSRV
jgi:hypothetical protein